MGIIAWIILGLATGLTANMLITGKGSAGLTTTCLLGAAGGLLGGWAATSLFLAPASSAFFSLPAWLTAVAGSALLLLAYRLVIERPPRRMAHR